MKISWKTVAINLFLFSLGLILVWLAFKGQNLSDLVSALKHINYFYVVISVLILGLSHFFRGLRWIQLIRPLGYQPSPFLAFRAVMIGYLANLALPRVGEITRCGVIFRATGAPVDNLLGTVITERIWDLITLLFITLLAFFLQLPLFSDFFSNNISPFLNQKLASLWILMGIILTVILLSILVWKLWLSQKLKVESNPGFLFLIKFWNGLLNGIKSFIEMDNKPLFVLYTFLIWAGYALSTWILFYSIASTSALGFKEALLVLSLGSFGMVAPVQGGIGAYHWMASQALLLYKIPLFSGLVYATINHSSGVLLIIGLGSISLITFLFEKPMDKFENPNDTNS